MPVVDSAAREWCQFAVMRAEHARSLGRYARRGVYITLVLVRFPPETSRQV